MLTNCTWRSDLRFVDIEGLFCASHGDELVVWSERRYLPCFTDEEKLIAFMFEMKFEWDFICGIDDADELMADLRAGRLQLIVDPVVTSDGAVEFMIALDHAQA